MVMTHDTGHWKIATRAKRSRNIHHIYALDNSIKILKYPRWQTRRLEWTVKITIHGFSLCIVNCGRWAYPHSNFPETENSNWPQQNLYFYWIRSNEDKQGKVSCTNGQDQSCWEILWCLNYQTKITLCGGGGRI